MAGTVVTLVVSASTINYTYDPAGRIISADLGAGKSISYAYDSAGNLIQSSQPAPGLVVGAIVNSQVTISWPAAPGGFVLESSFALGAGALWTDAGITPVPNGNQLTVTISLTGPTKFYRLRKP